MTTEPYLPGETPAEYLARVKHDPKTWISPLFGKPIAQLTGEERRAECIRMTGGTEEEIAAAVAAAKASTP